MPKRILAKTARLGYHKQDNAGATWDEVGTSNTAYKEILFNAKVTVPEPSVMISNFDYAGNTGSIVREDRVYVDGTSELSKINFSGFAYKENLARELSAIMQKVVEYNLYRDNASTQQGASEITVVDLIGIAVGQTVSVTGTTFDGGESTTAVITAINTETGVLTLDKVVDKNLTDVDMTIVDCPKEFIPDDTVIDFANDEGYLYTIAHQNYNGTSAGDGVKLDNAILESYTLSIANEGASGLDKLLKTEGTWVGNVLTPNVDFTGIWSPAPATPTYYKNFTLALTIGSTSYTNLCWKNFQIKFDRTVNRICDTTKANNYTTELKIEATIDIPYNDATYGIFSKYKQGDNVSFNFYSCADGILNTYHGSNLGITSTKGILKANPYQYDGEYVALRLSIDILKPIGGFYPVIIMADNILGGY